MEPLFHAAPFTGYVYPNETVIAWSVLIVVYPYLTGLVAGSFTVSSLYHVFGMRQFEPVARFSMLLALCLMLCVPLPLLLHLGHPERAFNAMITPHLTSAFAIFGYAASFYTVLLLLENWFVYRPQIVQIAREGRGPLQWICRVVALGSDDLSEKAMHYDHKWIVTLAIIGIPAALGLHGYVGFVFGSLKSREWWSSDLMPAVFLLSAVISGTALVIVLYVVTSLARRVPIDTSCVRGLVITLWSFLIFALLLEGVEFASLMYRSREGIEMIREYVAGRLVVPFFVLQLGLGSLLPLVLLSLLIVRRVQGRALIVTASISAVLILFAVLMMRWNVVIGGQEIAKTGKGLVQYQPEWVGREGLLAAGAVLVLPLLLLYLATRIVSPWAEESRAAWLRTRAPLAPAPVAALLVAALLLGSGLAVGPAARAAEPDLSGKEVVAGTCIKCHGGGLNGAPRIGDAQAWSVRARQGLASLTEHALQGIRKMPPHGSNFALSDIEIQRAITYMVNQSGGHWAEPISKSALPAERTGEQVVHAQCRKCHEAGVGGAPRIGDANAWAPRLKHGLDALVRSAINGHGGMPARGGMIDLTDTELRHAITFMYTRKPEAPH